MAKAKTKAAKIRAKRGRPRMEANAREPNGRPSRRVEAVRQRLSETEKQIKATAKAARARIYHISDAQTDRSEAGYVLGRLFLAGQINKSQLDAGNRMSEEFARYYGLTGIPMPSARAQDLFAVKGEPGPCRPDAARSASNAVMAIEKALGSADVSGRPITSITKRVCVQDDASGLEFGHMVSLLRRGLDALSLHYKIEG